MANFFHPSVKIGKLVSIEISTRDTHTFIGENSVIDDFVKIKHVGGNGDVRLGAYVYLNSCTVLYSGNGITIGNNVLVGPNCNIVPVNHSFLLKYKTICEQGFQKSRGGVLIEDDVWLGANVTLLDGTIIRKGCVIAAGSLLSFETEEYSVYAGNPAKKIKIRN